MPAAIPANPSDEPKMFTVAEVAARLKLGIRTVYRFMDDGTLPPGVKLGGARRIPSDQLAAVLTGQWQPSRPTN